MKNFINSSVTRWIVALATVVFVLSGAFQTEKLACKVVRTDWKLYNISEEIKYINSFSKPTDKDIIRYNELQKERKAFIDSTDSVEKWCATTNDLFQLMSGIVAVVVVIAIPIILLIASLYAIAIVLYIQKKQKKSIKKNLRKAC